MLSDRLKKLVAAGILTKDDAARGQRARYSLTEAGIQTLPIIFALGNWGLDWRTGTRELRARQELMRAEGMPFIEDLMQDLRTRHLDAVPVGNGARVRSNGLPQRMTRSPASPATRGSNVPPAPAAERAEGEQLPTTTTAHRPLG
ncbi:winged helix-turn-helix transcriptional regulator [Nocardia sp. NBC_01329]|nr:winged helix-turn-helix transcriptional regulator [Nocardia sp. NBC_01329]